MPERSGRSWGFWTRGKLDILRDYLDAFTTTTKNLASERIYLDLFAGVEQNYERGTDVPLEGSARIALQTDNPPFSQVRLFERQSPARDLRLALKRDFPDRQFEVIPGDCNQTLPGALAELRRLNWAPTFAFIDPNGPHVHWDTLKALADFKSGRSKTKVEFWLLFAAGMFTRNLRVDGGRVRETDRQQLNDMFGTDQWEEIYHRRLGGEFTGAEAREHYVNLMRWRLEHSLGYRWTHPLEVKTDRRISLYHMIFATTSQTGNKIITDLYGKAARRFPAMREEAAERRRIERTGAARLFPLTELEPGDLYQYEPAAEPPGTI